MRRLEALAWAVGVLGVAACSRGGASEQHTGSLEVEWTGADTGKLSAPAIAEWCDSLGVLELRAIHGDTGFALALYPADSVGTAGPGRYRVRPPAKGTARPWSALALRWFAETSIRGFRSDSGAVTVDSSGAGIAGRFDAGLSSATDASKLTVKGSFKGLTVTPAGPECAGRLTSPDDEDEATEPTDEDDFGIASDSA
jgi:hypothetical protein